MNELDWIIVGFVTVVIFIIIGIMSCLIIGAFDEDSGPLCMDL